MTTDSKDTRTTQKITVEVKITSKDHGQATNHVLHKTITYPEVNTDLPDIKRLYESTLNHIDIEVNHHLSVSRNYGAFDLRQIDTTRLISALGGLGGSSTSDQTKLIMYLSINKELSNKDSQAMDNVHTGLLVGLSRSVLGKIEGGDTDE